MSCILIAYLIYKPCFLKYTIIVRRLDMLEIKNEYNDYVTKTFRIPHEITAELEEQAKLHNTSVNKVVIQCLEYALKNISSDS